MKPFLITLCLFLFMITANAQNLEKVHINLSAGISNYQGDLQDKRFTFAQSNLAGGLGVSYDLSDRFSIRTGLMIGKLSADDKYGRNKARNLNFTTKLYEGQLGLEYYITPLADHALTPYIFASVALFHFSPYTHDTSGNVVFLSPLSTEGEGFISGRSIYKRTQIAIPFGGGAKLSLSENINVGIELGFRKLFTDYLDDVSTTYVDRNLLLANRGPKAVELAYRGDELKNGSPYPPAGNIRGAKAKDWYYFTGLTISFRLGNSFGGGGGSGGRHSQYGCPVNVR